MPSSLTPTQAPAGSPARPRQRPQRPRDAEATRQLILDAAVSLLAERGFTGLGVNTLAAAAGVDKQLIYYHFGGLQGVVRQLGARLELWLGDPLQPRDGEPYGHAVQRLMAEYASALERSVLVQRLLAWELVEPSAELAELERTRSTAMVSWVASLHRASGPPPSDVDAPAVHAVLLAAIHYLALRRPSVGRFAGVDIASPEGASRITQAIQFILQRVYGTQPAATLDTP